MKLSQKSGRLQAHGSLDMHDRQSNMTIELDHLPIAQQPDRWIVVSGNSLIGFKEQALAITGKIVTDVGFIKQPAAGKPGLAEDVVIAGKSDAVTEPKSPAMQVNLDAVLDLGEQFFLRASGLEGRLQCCYVRPTVECCWNHFHPRYPF
ncbi:MAG: translocation/assembly module TamB domain-containing protein [Burkholderiales bacterium]|nr:translocation/assembly module TamB domain-containing protein [Burkholderiales bacterium]